MNKESFKQSSLIMATQIYPNLTGDALIAEAERIYRYMTDDKSTNMLALMLMSSNIGNFADILPIQPLYDYQLTTLQRMQTGDDLAIQASRQMGLTHMLCIYATWLANFKRDQVIVMMTSTYAQSKELCERVLHLHDGMRIKCAKLTKINKTELHFDNGTKIIFLANPDYMRGRSVNYFLLDNAAYISFAHEDNLHMSMVTMVNGQSIVASATGVGRGLFYDIMTSPNMFKNKIQLHYSAHPQMNTPGWNTTTSKYIGADAFQKEYEMKFEDIN